MAVNLHFFSFSCLAIIFIIIIIRFGLIYLPAIVSVSIYFEKKRGS